MADDPEHTLQDKDRGHTWKRDEDGNIDIFAFNPYDPHNGPNCTVCHYGYCHHCEDGPQEDCDGGYDD